jgi:hypothetical protein
LHFTAKLVQQERENEWQIWRRWATYRNRTERGVMMG